MRIRITAGGIYDGKGSEIPIGTEVDVADFEVNEEGQPVEPHPWGGRFTAISGSQKGKTPVTNDDPPAGPVGPFEVRDDGNGWHGVYGADGEKVKSLRKDDAEAFAGLSPEDQVAYLTEA